MIKKFIKIRNVGKFRNFSASGDISLHKVNIIYGENSVGKSTLVSIVRSLHLNNPDLILKKKTFGANDEPYIELLFSNNEVFRFQTGNWSNWKNELKNIEIFDEFFVNENVYTGMEIFPEHQKRLYGFVMGEEGVELAKEIEKIKEELQSEKYPKLEKLENQIEILIKNNFDVETYINLTEDPEIDEKIQEKEHKINIAKEFSEIRQKENLKEIPKFSLPFDLNILKTILKKSLTTISEDALQKTKQHINKLVNAIGEKAEEWIHQGLLVVEHVKDNKCPFCQQDLTKAEIMIKSYQQYFNQEYRKIDEEVKQYLYKIEKFNIERILNDAKNIILRNNGLLEFWKRFIKNIEIFEIKKFEEYSSKINEYFRKVKLALENKSKKILSPIETDYIDKLQQIVSKFNTAIEDYNFKVKNLNTQISELKEKQPDIEKLEKELEKLKIKKRRFSPEIMRLCEEYKNVKNEINKIKKTIRENQEKLKFAVSEKIQKYGKKTNIILEKFGIPFKIIKQISRYRGKGKEPYFEYFLEYEGAEINPLSHTKFALSAGDRNGLALSFFIAKLYIDGDLQNKIIIFDDPISSFDINRKRRTIEIIRDLAKKAKQVIIFTHFNTFAFELYDTLRDIGIAPQCLQIKNGKIIKWNIEEDKKLPYFKNLAKLESFLNGEEIPLDEIRRLIRICLEDKLKFNYFQFFKDLGEDCWLGSMVNKLRKIKDNPSLKFKHSNKDEVINELSNLCDFSKYSHHSCITASYRTDYARNELENYVKSTLKMIYEWL